MYSSYFTIRGTKILNLLCLIICAKHWDFYLFVFVTVWKKYSNNDKKNPINLLNNNAFFLLSSGLFSDIERQVLTFGWQNIIEKNLTWLNYKSCKFVENKDYNMRISKKIKQDEISEITQNLINWCSIFFLICIEQSMIKYILKH